jgi:hypothetical protein
LACGRSLRLRREAVLLHRGESALDLQHVKQAHAFNEFCHYHFFPTLQAHAEERKHIRVS